MFKYIKNSKTTAIALAGLMTASSSIIPSQINTSQATSIEEVSVELLLSVDVSTSVDYHEFELQRQGYIGAFQSAEVKEAIKNMPDGLAVNMQFWAEDRVTELGWYKLINDGNGGISNFPEFINAMQSVVRKGDRDASGNPYPSAQQKTVTINGTTTNVGAGTDIELAIKSATDSILNNNYKGDSLVIDVSGDGIPDDTPYAGADVTESHKANYCGYTLNCPPVKTASEAAVAQNIVINGLPIVGEAGFRSSPATGGTISLLEDKVDLHYRDYVIGGEGAFYVRATFETFAQAVKTKICREINYCQPIYAD
jgi:hypothetical protein